MKYLIYFISIVFLIGVNGGLFSYLKIDGAGPNLLLLLLIIFSLEKGSYDFFFLAMVSGIFLDFYSGAYFGSFTIAFLALGLLLHLMVNNVLMFEVSWKYVIVVLAGSLFIVNLLAWVYGMMAFKFGWASVYPPFENIQKRYIIELCYNLLLLYPVYRFAAMLKHINETIFDKRKRLIS